MNEPDWRRLTGASMRDHILFATAFALLISFSVSVALVSWAAPITAQAISLDVQKYIDGWQL